MPPTRRQILIYAVLAALVIAVGVRYVLPSRGSGEPAGAKLELAASGSPSAPRGASPASSPAGEVVVYVCGAVRSPGLVRLPTGARVADALKRAGGATSGAELAALNLAAKLADGQQIVVPRRGEAAAAGGAAQAGGPAAAGSSSAAGPAAAGAPVNINTASLEELDSLTGIGPATAQKIIDYRTANGAFKTIDDIKQVPGIGPAKFEAIKANITV